jgi:3-oxoacyl-[acyl-carrier-protein] synthase II
MLGSRMTLEDPRPSRPDLSGAHRPTRTARRRVVVTGVGPVSAIGCGRNEFWDALIAGRHGIGPVTLCDVSASPSKIGAEVKGFDLERYLERGGQMARFTPRPTQFALAAAVLALHDAEIDVDACDPERFGIHVGTSVGNMQAIMDANAAHLRGAPMAPHTAFHSIHHSIGCVVSATLNIRGPLHTTTSGCNSGLDALGQSLRLIEAGALDRMLVIGTDCELVPEVFAALNASESLATRYNDDPGRASRPFDRARDGNVLGEGAAALLLEAQDVARSRQARVYARFAGFHQASAGFNRQYKHKDADVDLRPCVRALRGAVTDAGWAIADVDLVNANGSSSVAYDRIEAMALRETFGEHLPDAPVHSIKSMLGQHGAGSSALQAVTACLAIRRRGIPPTINHDDPDPECGPLPVVIEALSHAPKRVLVHAIGLGGFYYSAACFEALELPAGSSTLNLSGMHRVGWSLAAHPRYKPTEMFQKPLVPWRPAEG